MLLFKDAAISEVQGGSRRGFAPGDATPAWLSALMLALLAWALVSTTYNGAINRSSGIHGIDFKDFYRAADRWNHGLPLYPTSPNIDAGYVYSPLLAMILRPVVAHYSFEQSFEIWYFVNVAAIFAGVAMFAASLQLTWKSTAAIGVMLVMAIGQCNYILFMCVCGMYWADRRGNLWILAAFLALAALIKVWIAVAGIYLVLRRAWKPAVGAALMYAAALLALFEYAGLGQFKAFIATTQSHSVQPDLLAHSILGFAKIHFAPNLYDLNVTDSKLIFTAFVGVGVLLVLAGFYMLWRLGEARSEQELRLRLGVAIASVLLLLPLYHYEYIVICLPLWWTLMIPARGETRPASGWLPAAVALALYLVLMRGGPYYAPFVPEYRHSARAFLVSVPFYLTVALWVAALGSIAYLRRGLSIKAAQPSLPLAKDMDEPIGAVAAAAH
jgi:hypothetical protein